MVQKMGLFNGMNVDALKGVDGQYTIKLAEAEFALFQANQANGACAPAPAGSMSFNISKDPSKLNLHGSISRNPGATYKKSCVIFKKYRVPLEKSQVIVEKSLVIYEKSRIFK